MKVVLIVEDNDKNMKLARDVLQAKGYATIEAVTGEDGVRLARRAQSRPRAHGHPASRGSAGLRRSQRYAPTRRPRASRWWRSPPPSLRPTAPEITQAGFDAFLAKPMVLREFVDTVKRLVESGRT